MRLFEQRVKLLEMLFDNQEVESQPNFSEWTSAELDNYICNAIISKEYLEDVLSVMVEKKYINANEVESERKNILALLKKHGKQI